MQKDHSALDAYDRHLLQALREDGRRSITDLAEQIGLSKTPTLARLRRLERQGVIVGYSAIIDQAKLGNAHIAFVEVKLTHTHEPALAAFNRALKTIAQIEQAHMIASNFDYLLKVRCQDMQDYRRILGEKISTLPYVSSTSSYIAMQTIK